jgi:hypothetical protein
MNRFDVSVYAIRRRRGRRRPFEVRWQAAGRARSKSFLTRALADSYRAELVRAARKGLEFDPQTGEPVLWAALPHDWAWVTIGIGLGIMVVLATTGDKSASGEPPGGRAVGGGVLAARHRPPVRHRGRL